MATRSWKSLATELQEQLHLDTPPLAITFSDGPPSGVPRHDGEAPPPAVDGRTGKVPAGCVFWMEAERRTFTTAPEDHANCSVGSLTHGLKLLDEIAGNSDVEAILESGWATLDMAKALPVVEDGPAWITYGPLVETEIDPDVVFLRLNAKQLMILHDALPELRVEGKPQCHVIPIAKEQGEPAASVGCMLSRVRTGMPNHHLTCAVPARRLAEVVDRLARTSTTDRTVAGYAAEDAKRFSR